jgi:polar amino acid transport system permease protein
MFLAASSLELLALWKGNLLTGALSTLQISFLAYAFGLCLGLAGAMGKLAGGKFLKSVLDLYTTLIR